MLSLGYTPTSLWCPLDVVDIQLGTPAVQRPLAMGLTLQSAPNRPLLSSAPLLGPVLSGGPQPGSFKKPLLWADSHWLADSLQGSQERLGTLTGTPWVSDIDGTSV